MLVHTPRKKFWVPQSPTLWFKASSGGGGTTPTRIQGNFHSNGAASSTTCAATLPSTVGSGHGVLVACGTTSTVTGVSDDKGNTYNLQLAGTGGGFSWSGAWLLNLTNTPQTITFTQSASAAFSTIFVTEFSNLLTGGFDGYAINIPQTGVNTTNGITSNTVTTTAAGDLVWGACVNVSGNSTLVKGTAFTADQNSGADFVTEYLIQGSAGAQAALFTGTTADTFGSFVMAFQHA